MPWAALPGLVRLSSESPALWLGNSSHCGRLLRWQRPATFKLMSRPACAACRSGCFRGLAWLAWLLRRCSGGLQRMLYPAMKRMHFCTTARLWVSSACCCILLLICAPGALKLAPMMRLALGHAAGQALPRGRLAGAAELLVVMLGVSLWRVPQAASTAARLLCDHRACRWRKLQGLPACEGVL